MNYDSYGVRCPSCLSQIQIRDWFSTERNLVQTDQDGFWNLNTDTSFGWWFNLFSAWKLNCFCMFIKQQKIQILLNKLRKERKINFPKSALRCRKIIYPSEVSTVTFFRRRHRHRRRFSPAMACDKLHFTADERAGKKKNSIKIHICLLAITGKAPTEPSSWLSSSSGWPWSGNRNKPPGRTTNLYWMWVMEEKALSSRSFEPLILWSGMRLFAFHCVLGAGSSLLFFPRTSQQRPVTNSDCKRWLLPPSPSSPPTHAIQFAHFKCRRPKETKIRITLQRRCHTGGS